MVFLLVAGCSVYLGFLASAQLQLVSGSGSSPYPLDVSISVMLWAAFLVMTDITLRWFRFLRSGRFPRASRLWRRVLTCLLGSQVMLRSLARGEKITERRWDQATIWIAPCALLSLGGVIIAAAIARLAKH